MILRHLRIVGIPDRAQPEHGIDTAGEAPGLSVVTASSSGTGSMVSVRDMAGGGTLIDSRGIGVMREHLQGDILVTD